MSNDEGEDIVSDYYDNYKDTQKEVLAIEQRKLRNALFTLCMITFLGDFFGLLILKAVTAYTVGFILILPLILLGLAFLSVKEPIFSIGIAAILIIGIWVYTIVTTRGQAALMGWLIKAIMVYFIIAGFQHAREAARLKKELKE